MTVISAQLGFGRSLGAESFADLTTGEVRVAFGSDGRLAVTVTPDVTPDVARAIRCRVISQGSEDEALRVEIARLLDQPAGPERTEALLVALAQLAVLVP